MAGANQYRQPGILCKSRVREREFAHKKNRAALRLDPARMLAILAEANADVGLDRRIVARRHPDKLQILDSALKRN
jgi:hypothetical protein